MSIVNFTFITRHNAVVSVDTLATNGRDAAKMHVMPHLGAVVAGRGRSMVFERAAGMLNQYSTFDEALANLTRVFNRADIWRASMLETGCFEKLDDLFRQTLLLVGYSESKGGLAAGFVQCKEAWALPQTSMSFWSVAAPDDGADSFDPAKLATDEGAKGLMEAQHTLLSADGTRCTSGGRCLVARLNAQPPTRGSIKPRVEIVMRDLGPLATVPSPS